MPSEADQRREYVHPTAEHAKKKPASPYAIEPITAFYIFLASSVASAYFAPIQDCDETYNYWEPTHYLAHGYGLQTWEYSPEFALRSWLYIALHAIVGSFRRLLPRPTKVAEFYFVRYVLAFGCALCQTLLFRVISFTLNNRIGLFFVLATVLSPGNFHASTAFLPSSFAMYASLLGAAAFMNWRGGLRTSLGIFNFALGAILGWPFAAALSLPFLLEEAVFALFSNRKQFVEAVFRVGRGGVAALLLLGFDTLVNTLFYREIESATWNIIKYNIFSSSGGPNLYGTEPWTFYFRNLAINFNIWFILALSALPLFMIQKFFSSKQHGFQSGLRTVVFLSPFYLWMGIFTMQPHKEERFMYPAYPFISLNAALALHVILSAFGSSDPKTLVGKIPAKLKLLAVTSILFLSLDLSIARIVGVYTAYSAPMKIYSPFQQGIGNIGENVCFGKEWYRFPSSYFLPNDMHAKFIRSEFRGLLPGQFAENQTELGGFRSGTWLLPSGMNDLNREDMGKYTDIEQCSYLVDTQYPENMEPLPPNEPDYISDEEHWQIIKCEPFLDAGNTHFLARVLWVPESKLVPKRYRRKWGRHCLLQRRR